MKKRILRLILPGLLLAGSFPSMAQTPGRETVPLSGYEWKLTLDPQAQWRADELYVPPVNVASLPVNPPTGGWEALRYRR